MARRRRLDPEALELWLQGLPQWKKEALKVILEAPRPPTTGEILEAINYKTTLSVLHNYLARLEKHGLLKSITIFMNRKKAWKPTPEAKTILQQLLLVSSSS